MKKLFTAIILFFSVSVSAAEMSPLNLQIQPDFDKKFECVWKSQSPLKVWIGPIEDARAQKEVATLIVKDQETPLYSSRPVTSVLQETLRMGLTKCGYQTVAKKDQANLLVGGVLEDFSGSSKKGFLKGKAQGQAGFTLNLESPLKHETATFYFEREETQEKGISKKPKKLEKILNNLLTRVVLDVFQSRQVGAWLSSK